MTKPVKVANPIYPVVTMLLVLLCGVTLAKPSVAGNPADTFEYALQDELNSLSNVLTRADDRDALKSFYANRQNRPLWVDEVGPTRAARRMIAELERAEDWGLDANGLKLAAVHAPLNGGRWSAVEAAAAEYEISSVILLYARQARGGRIPEPARMLSTYLDRRPVMMEPALVLERVTTASEPDAELRSLHPQHEQFRKLQAIYAKLLAQKNLTGEAGRIPEKGPVLMPGQRHVDIAALRQRLDVPARTEDLELYDDALVEAVEKFQDAESLKSDGIIGHKTRKALNASVDDKLKSIRANMEQWRWMPEDLGATHVFVNLPAFEVNLVESGTVTLKERVIVGRNTTQTPVFSRKLSTIVLKPSWQLPESIKVQKLIDAQRRGSSIEDEGYVIKKGEKTIESWKVDWSEANITAYTFFQPAGDGNALGKVKFLFPNKHSVYLHDTPTKSLFDTSERLYSHGCVRLRNPVKFAQRLLDIAQGQGTISAEEAVEDGPENNQIILENPIPIHLGYFTVWIDENGQAEFHGDPYGHEKRVTLALDNKWDEIDKGTDHLAAVDTQELKKVRVEPPEKQAGRSARVAKVDASPVSATARASVQARKRFAPAMGVTKVVHFPRPQPARSYAGSRVHRVTAGDLMRQAFGR